MLEYLLIMIEIGTIGSSPVITHGLPSNLSFLGHGLFFSAIFMGAVVLASFFITRIIRIFTK